MSDGTVNGSRVDQRDHRGNCCNVKNTGIGFMPKASPDPDRPYLDAYYWLKPTAESDGIADSTATGTNEEGKSFDPKCGPATKDAK